MSDECIDCEKAKGKPYYGIYNLKCRGCRDRMIVNESCKIHREIVYKGLLKYGECGEWKIEPNCGCTNRCKRRQSSKSMKDQL